MFEHHNKYTKLTYWLLTINSIVGFISIGTLLPNLGGKQSFLIYCIASLVSLMLLLNTYLAYRVFRKSASALTLSLWLYGFQSVGYENVNWELSLNFGMNLSLIWNYGLMVYTLNILAIIMLFILFKARRSVQKYNI